MSPATLSLARERMYSLHPKKTPFELPRPHHPPSPKISLFADYVGVSPKWVMRRARLHEAAARANGGEPVDWAALAVTSAMPIRRT